MSPEMVESQVKGWGAWLHRRPTVQPDEGRSNMADYSNRGPCKVEGCVNVIGVIKYQLCGMHYQRMKAHGDPGEAQPRRQDRNRACAVRGCVHTFVVGFGMCATHVNRLKRTGDPGKGKIAHKMPATGMTCSREGCESGVYSTGLCRNHKQREFYASMPDGLRQEYNRILRAKAIGAPVFDVTPKQIARMMDRARGLCFYCHQRIERMEFDHVIPVSRTGVHSAGNIVVACSKCNQRKHDKFVMEFRLYMKRKGLTK